MFTLENNSIYEHRFSPGGAEIKEHYGSIIKVKVRTSKEYILADGIDATTITLRWEKFDVNQGQYVIDTTSITDFVVNVAGIVESITPTNGQSQVIYSSNEPGNKIIKSQNPGVNNDEVQVIVQ